MSVGVKWLIAIILPLSWLQEPVKTSGHALRQKNDATEPSDLHVELAYFKGRGGYSEGECFKLFQTFEGVARDLEGLGIHTG